MKLLKLLIFLLIGVNSGLSAQNVADRPRIIRSVPAFGDCNVDPNLKEIELEFDQDMKEGYSVMDGAYKFKITSKPIWKTNRILLLPVTLEPNTFYLNYLNNNNFSNFRNKAGLPLNATYLTFRTRATTAQVPTDTLRNKILYEKFSDYFLKHYANKNLHGVNWKKLLDSIEPAIVKSDSENEFGLRLLQILKKADDPLMLVYFNKIYFNCTDFRITPFSHNYVALFDELTNLQSSQKQAVYSGKIGDAAYVLIKSFNSYFTDDINFAIEKIKEMRDMPYLILDLRMNADGDDKPARKLISSLLTNPITYQKIKTFNESTSLFDKSETCTLNPDMLGNGYKGKIIVLTGESVMRSAESALLMIKQMPNVQIIGSKTYGSCSYPTDFEFSKTFFVAIPSLQVFDMNDQLIQGNGIKPDVEIAFTEEQVWNSDPVFEYAKKLINYSEVKTGSANDSLGFQIWPENVKDVTTLSWKTQFNTTTKVELLDRNGKTVMTQSPAEKPEGINQLQLNLSDYRLKPGKYLAKLTCNNISSVQQLIYLP
ncbi:MAG TPA: S41 family peptidase [Paludibacter sp.]